MKRPLGLIVLSGDYVRVHFALMTAAAAAAVDRPVTLFVTMEAVPLALGGEGWRRLRGAARDDDMKAAGVADVETLLRACADLDVSFIVCETGLKAQGTSAGGLRGDMTMEVAGLVTLFEAVGNGEVISF